MTYINLTNRSLANFDQFLFKKIFKSWSIFTCLKNMLLYFLLSCDLYRDMSDLYNDFLSNIHICIYTTNRSVVIVIVWKLDL
jgi:hypothetical protein